MFICTKTDNNKQCTKMKQEALPYHLSVISSHNHWMYNKLIYEHHVTSGSLKEVVFEGYHPARGYFARKDRKKYWIDEQAYKMLPLKPGKEFEELVHKEDVVYQPQLPTPFKIIPEQKFDNFKVFVDDFIPFQHSNPEQWLLLKLIAIIGYVSRIYVCIASNPEFGKSSIYEVLHGLTDKCPVFKPRSVPGVLNKINGIGNIVFDDVLESKKEVRDIMEEFNLKVAGGSSVYINGAMKSANTRNTYPTPNQSITYLYNNLECYNNPDKYFDRGFFDNEKAINTRFLKFKFEGKLIEKFTKDFDIPQVAKENRMHYINIAKHLLWMQDLKSRNGYKRRYDIDESLIPPWLKGRRRAIFDDILWECDMYAESRNTFNGLVKGLIDSINAYQDMVNTDTGNKMTYSQINPSKDEGL